MQHREALFPIFKGLGRISHTVILILLLIATQEVSGQLMDDIITHSVYSIEDGLPTNEVYDCNQDTKGYLWLSTDLGLVRFDGVNFKTYTKDDGLPSLTIFSTYEDEKGRLWALTFREGVFYIEEDSVIIPPFNEDLKSYLTKNYIHNLRVIGDSVFMSTRYSQDSIYAADVFGDVRVKQIPGMNLTLGQGAKYIWQWKLEEDVSLSGITGARARAPEKGPISYSSISSGSTVEFHNLAERDYNRHCLETLGDSVTVLAHGSRVAMIDSHGQISYIELPSKVLDIELYNDNILLATLGEGVYHFKGSLSKAAQVGHYFVKDAITSIERDNQGKIWLTSLNNGLINVPSLFSRSYFLIGATNSETATQLKVQGDTLAYIIQDSLFLNRITSYDLEPIVSYELITKAHRDVLYPSYLHWQDEWSFLYHNLLYQIDFNNDGYLEGEQATSTVEPFVYTVHDHEDVLYFGTRHGLYYFLKGNEFYSKFSIGFEKEVYTITSKNDSVLLLGTQEGVYEYHTRKENIIGVIPSTQGFAINDLTWDEYGRLWIATKEDGLFIHSDGETERLKVPNIPNLFVCYDVEVEGQNAWLGSSAGLIRFAVDEESVSFVGAFTKLDGLAFDFIEEVLVNGHDVILRSANTICTMPAERLVSEDIDPILYFESIRVENNEYRGSKINNIVFPQGPSNLEFTVRPNILNQKGLELSYRLASADTTWRSLNNNSISFVQVPPGKYELNIRYRTKAGHWSDAELSYAFTIEERLTNRTWFRSLIAVILISIFVGIIYARRATKQKRALLENQMMRSGLRSLRTQINPHFMFNALNSIRHFILDNNLNKADGYLVKFSGLLRGVLENMERYKVPLEDEIELLNAYLTLEESRLRYGLDWNIELDQNIPKSSVLIPTMLFQPLLENSIWHGVEPLQKRGKVTLSFQQEGDQVICTLQDNGLGFDPDQEDFTEGIGLKNVLERLKLYQQLDERPYDISIESRTGEANHGTTITIKIPI